ncbi:hypothetical protein BvCmsB1661_03308 [Escherichia coli]|nr:hypothetical protein BvCmsB1661_03308 [Escherichia coli]
MSCHNLSQALAILTSSDTESFYSRVPKAKRLKPKMVPVAGWKETQVSDMDFDTIMEKAYEEYFEGLAEGEEALSFSEFKQALSSSAKSNG